MYAIIENGGKQYKTIEGKYIEIDLLPDEVGKKKSFENVLLLSTGEKVEVGEPFLKGVSINGTIIAHFKGPKLTVFKYRAKKRYRVKTGHRQKYTRVQIDSIAFPGKAEVVRKVEEDVVVDEPSAAKKTTTVKKPAAVKKSTSTKKPAAAKAQTAVKKKTAAKKPAVAKAQTTAKKTTSTKKPAGTKKPSADEK